MLENYLFTTIRGGKIKFLFIPLFGENFECADPDDANNNKG